MTDYIPGVYNYCNRWCERCTFTKVCRMYADSREFEEEHGPQPSMEAVLGHVKEMMEKTMQLLQASAAKHGIELTNLPEVEDSPLPLTAEQEELVAWCRQYSDIVRDVFEDHKAEIREHFSELEKHYEMNLHGVEKQARKLNDALETIQWYQHFIYVKCRRALLRYPEDSWDDPVQNDANGTAKVMLIACRDSFRAWEVLLVRIEPIHEKVLDVLSILSRILRRTEQLFPHAEEFVRPGFDE